MFVMFDLDELNETIADTSAIVKHKVEKHSKIYSALASIAARYAVPTIYLTDAEEETVLDAKRNYDNLDDECRQLLKETPVIMNLYPYALMHGIIRKLETFDYGLTLDYPRFDKEEEDFIIETVDAITSEDHPFYAIYRCDRESLCKIVLRCPFQMNLNWIDVSQLEDFHGIFFNKNFNGDISLWKLDHARDLTGMFSYSSIQVDVSKWKFPKVTNMSQMFMSACLNDTDLSQWEFPNVENTSYMFRGAYSNSPARLSNWKFPKIKTMQGMFSVVKFTTDISGWEIPDDCCTVNMFEVCEIPEKHRPKCLKNKEVRYV